MGRRRRLPFVFTLVLSGLLSGLLGACAPTIVGRTPQPTALGETEVTLGFGYPFSLTAITVCQGPRFEEGCPLGYLAPAYWPLAAPLHLLIAQGLEGARAGQ